jgi:hypothetical protein
MKTVQLAIQDSKYVQALRTLLLRDGTRRVHLVERPDLALDGVVVIDANNPENVSLLESDPERFVVIARTGTDNLSRIWEAGATHVVFEQDPPTTSQLSIIAAELRLSPRSRD